MRQFLAVAFITMLALAAPASAQQFAGYLCEVTLVSPTSGPYGSSGYLQIQLTSSPGCRGNQVAGVALYHLTQGATVQGADASFLLTEGQLMTLLHSYSAAAANKNNIRINTKNFGGGLQVQGVTFLSN